MAWRKRRSSKSSMAKALTTRCPRTPSATRLERSARRSWLRWLVRRMLWPKRTIGKSMTGAAIRHRSASLKWVESRSTRSTIRVADCCRRSSSRMAIAFCIIADVVDHAAHQLARGMGGVEAARLLEHPAVEVVADVGGGAETDVLEGVAGEEIGHAAQQEDRHEEERHEPHHVALVDAEALLEPAVGAVGGGLEEDLLFAVAAAAERPDLGRVPRHQHLAEDRLDQRHQRGRAGGEGEDRHPGQHRPGRVAPEIAPEEGEETQTAASTSPS